MVEKFMSKSESDLTWIVSQGWTVLSSPWTHSEDQETHKIEIL